MTIPQFKSRLRQQGITIRQWAADHGFPVAAVYRVLNGLDKGHFGRAHAILRAAGIKSTGTDRLAA